ncbi:MAG: (2Fe-2S)-binding protein [Pyrinomonadaceae bacterium]
MCYVYHRESVIYPEKITSRLAALSHDRTSIEGDAIGTAANFSCGCFIKFSLLIDTETHLIADVRFLSNGCGFILAAADVLSEGVIKKRLVDLNGLADPKLIELIKESLGEFPTERRACSEACIEALRSAFADFRTKQIEEFQGEKALICTCFGVSEETIENLILKNELTTVEDVTAKCNAGGGCGSCRMLIEEILEIYGAK